MPNHLVDNRFSMKNITSRSELAGSTPGAGAGGQQQTGCENSGYQHEGDLNRSRLHYELSSPNRLRYEIIPKIVLSNGELNR